MKAKTLCSLFVAVAMFSLVSSGLSARTLGMVADDADETTGETTGSVTVFDADTHAILGTLPIPPDPFSGLPIGDVLITPDLKRGFVTNYGRKVFVIDLTTSPPSLATGTNPIPISNDGNDLSISPDGKFLVVSSGSLHRSEPISVIDINTQTEISTFSIDADTVSVDVCSDGSVLVASFALLTDDSRTVRRLTLSGTGTLTDTGEVLSIFNPINVYCAPSAQSGVVIQLGIEEAVTSFTIPGLSAVNTRPLSGQSAFTAAINPAGNRVFARSSFPGSVDVFDFTQATGALGASPLLTFPVASVAPEFGIDQIALHPNGGKLYVSEPGAVKVYDPNTGSLLDSITDPNIVTPTGVTVAMLADPCAGPPPAGAIVGTNGPDILNGTPFGDTIFGLGGSDTINGRGGNDLICGDAGPDIINGGAGDDVIDSGAGSDIANGGTGSDTVKGGAGNDTLNVQDSVSGNDTVDGGTGNDACAADAGDTVTNCGP